MRSPPRSHRSDPSAQTRPCAPQRRPAQQSKFCTDEQTHVTMNLKSRVCACSSMDHAPWYHEACWCIRCCSYSCNTLPYLSGSHLTEQDIQMGSICNTQGQARDKHHMRAVTIDKVAEPPPALASTTSVPASWMRLVIASAAALSNSTEGVACEPQVAWWLGQGRQQLSTHSRITAALQQ